MYTVLTGARINVGDFLITHRAKKLLRALKPEHELFQLPTNEPLDPHLDRIHSGAAIIIMGGPGYQPRFHPGVYKLTRRIEDLRVPVIPMGLGWKGFPGDFETLKTYRFDAPSIRALQWISRHVEFMGCRDYLTVEALRRNGIGNALMTGCPVWYDLPSIGHRVRAPEAVRKVVFTPTQGHRLVSQSIEIMGLLRDLFPGAERFCSFHHGTAADPRVFKRSQIAANRRLVAAAAQHGFEVVDAARDLSRIAFYKDCDLHVGYRVHAHLDFLSRRRPSILIHEDGRGRGVTDALGAPAVDGFRRKWTSGMLNALSSRGVARVMAAADLEIGPDQDAPARLKILIEQELTSDFSRFAGVGQVIDAHFDVMKRFVLGLPS